MSPNKIPQYIFKLFAMNRPQHILTAALLLLSSFVFSQNLHHEMEAVLNIKNSTISLTDTVIFPDTFVAGHDSLVFYLNPHLMVKLKAGDFRLIKTVKQDKQPDASRYALLKTGRNTEKAVLECSGKVYDSLSTGAAEYARGFSETKGIISKKGVYLAGSSFWKPTFDTSLFTYNLTIQLPAKWLVVSQGIRTENDTANGIRTIRYECKSPQEEAFLTAARWTEYDTKAGDVKVQAFLRTPDKKLAMCYLNMTGVYLNMYVHLLGPYPYSKFALVENFWETGYGMPSFTLLGSRIIRFPFILYSSYPHELLHNWWGNSVYVATQKGNWSEGLTAYMADHLLKEQHGRGAEYRRNTLQKFTDFVNPENDFPVVDFRERHDAAEEAIGYGKSLMFQHMLRQLVGDSLYIRAYRQFYKDYCFKFATFDNIRTSFEKVTGRDFKPFFKEWLTRKGAPQLVLGDVKVRKPQNDYLLSFRLSQIQKENVFPLVVPVAVYFEDTVILRKIHMRNREMYPLLTFRQQPLRLEVDPQFDVFRRLDRGESPPSLSQLFGNENVTLILPANSLYLTEYKKLADIWQQTQEVQNKTLMVVFDKDLKQLPKDGDVWVIGFENKFANRFNVLKDYARYFNEKQLQRISDLHKTGALVYAIPNLESKGQTIGFVGANVKKSVSGLARLLPHYGKYSWLGFVGSRPDNVLKGTFPPLRSPLHYDIPVEGKRPAVKATLKPEPPL